MQFKLKFNLINYSLELTAEEYLFLENAFTDESDSNRVCYKALVEEVEKVFIAKVK